MIRIRCIGANTVAVHFQVTLSLAAGRSDASYFLILLIVSLFDLFNSKGKRAVCAPTRYQSHAD
jgi:hypothetical protein